MKLSDITEEEWRSRNMTEYYTRNGRQYIRATSFGRSVIEEAYKKIKREGLKIHKKKR